MIEVFESRQRFLSRCSQQERSAAEAAHTSEARQIHQMLAQMYEREARGSKLGPFSPPVESAG